MRHLGLAGRAAQELLQIAAAAEPAGEVPARPLHGPEQQPHQEQPRHDGDHHREPSSCRLGLAHVYLDPLGFQRRQQRLIAERRDACLEALAFLALRADRHRRAELARGGLTVQLHLGDLAGLQQRLELGVGDLVGRCHHRLAQKEQIGQHQQQEQQQPGPPFQLHRIQQRALVILARLRHGRSPCRNTLVSGSCRTRGRGPNGACR